MLSDLSFGDPSCVDVKWGSGLKLWWVLWRWGILCFLEVFFPSSQLFFNNRFKALQTEEAETTVEQSWANLKEALVGSCEEVLGRPPGNRKPWISDETWKKVEERKRAKEELNQARTRNQKQVAASKYSKVVGVSRFWV